MENREQELIFEENRLQKTIAIAKEQLKQAQAAVEGKQEKLIEAKRSVRENGAHSMANLYSADDFEALIELSQLMEPVTELVAACEDEERKIAVLENMIKCPYFARIDFRFDGEEDAEHVYIGRASLNNKKEREIYVYDWRSPIASVFYRFMTGNVFYDAPNGRIEGNVTRKRQYEIQNSVLEYFFDTDRNINDEFLRKMLSQNASPQMKAIVETIQKEQDIVIRDMESDLLMVQGVAGSGKTSIALHRAAYLMYQGLQAHLAANSILIISPNDAFEEYIAGVLPQLGEENVNSAVFEDMMRTVLGGRRMQTKNEFLEQAVTHNAYQDIVKRSMEFKTSGRFQAVLEQFLLDIPSRFIAYEDIYYKDSCVATKQMMRDWVMARPDVLLGDRLCQLEDYVSELAFGTAKKREDAQDRNRIRQEVQRFARLNLPALYRNIFFDKKWKDTRFAQLDEKDIWKYTRENLDSGCLYYEDAIAITYLHLKIYGSRAYRAIRQVVIDEAQDYYPLQYEIFRMLFVNAKFTVLGDMNQTLAKQEDLSLYARIPHMLGREKYALATLDKSFRCTNEILEFGLQFIEHRPQIRSFNRGGDAVVTAACRALPAAVIKEIRFCKEQGFASVCLLCKTQKNAQRLFEKLKTETDVTLVTDGQVERLHGTFLMPVYMAKGLEFDAVIICDADAHNYYDADDRKLLYVACTRALHRLCVFGEGSLSPLIRE